MQLFYNCKYTEALATLQTKLVPRLAIGETGRCCCFLCDFADREFDIVDLHLAYHTTFLCGSIRNKAIVQFFTPYSAVDLKCVPRRVV